MQKTVHRQHLLLWIFIFLIDWFISYQDDKFWMLITWFNLSFYKGEFGLINVDIF